MTKIRKNADKGKRSRAVSCAFAAVCIAILTVMAGCGGEAGETSSGGTAQPVKLNPEVTVSDKGEETFGISPEDFIKSFNSFYKMDNAEAYLSDIDSWTMYATGPTLHNSNETMCYAYSEEPAVRSIPKLVLYADSFASGIYQISICYDDHSYSPETYELYRELVFYTLRTMFPDKTDKDIKERTETMLKAVDDSFTTDKESANIMPELTYSENGIGLYPYYVVGELMEVRIIPVE